MKYQIGHSFFLKIAISCYLLFLLLAWGQKARSQQNTAAAPDRSAFAPKSKGATLQGSVLDADNEPLIGATVLIKNTSFKQITDTKGNFFFKDLPQGDYTLLAFAFGKATQERDFSITAPNQQLTLALTLTDLAQNLDAVEIQEQREATFGITQLKAIENFGIYEGKKTEVVVLEDLNGNFATNNPRQVYAKVTGLNIWESDGAGLQLGIGGRGLSPNRTSNFNVRQNGYDISADALGYPESYYTPPIEALERIEVIRGAASLQYGTQFGGLVNFRFKRGNENKKVELISRQSIGSWGFFNSFNSLGGTVAKGKLNYYTYAQYKRGNGYRENSEFEYYNFYGSFDFQATEKLNLKLDLTKMHYLAQQAGGLTDRMFADNPRQSIRARNWFLVDWNLVGLEASYLFSPQTQINIRSFGLIAKRLALGNLERINVADFGENRTLIEGGFQNVGTELRLLHRYQIGKQTHAFLVGTRLYSGTTSARQGEGSAGSDANFTFLNPNNVENSDYLFPNKNRVVFVENIFNLSTKLSLTPGLRFENIQTFSEGYFKQRVFDAAGNVIVENRVDENLNRKRSFVLAGLGLSYKKTEQVEFYANFSQNYRAINFSDLRIVNPNFVIDPNIQDEKGYTADLGCRGNFKDVFVLETTLFYLAYRDKIGQVLRADQPPLYNDYRFRGNISDARNIGLETFAEVDILKLRRKRPKKSADLNQNSPQNTQEKLENTAPKDSKWTFFVNFSLVDARYINTQDATIANKKVEMVAPLMLRTGTTWKYKSWSNSLQFSHTGEHFSDATNARRTATAVEGVIAAYQVWDISSSYTWKWLTIEGSLNNIFNQSYFTRRAEGYPGPGIIPADGRGFFLTLQGRF
ncbi:TonB-dependent receptor [Hugenholtzia roseola]|uniref:TonB-dependent receptor n=1 Tax=Hugenholtzia roseola TaxID=1002 RepID=UPI000411E823|nr:TonB-dependent receptor [Hugenholtzia roseola]